MWVLPTNTAPAAESRAATVLSAGARWPSRTRELAEVAVPATSIRSFRPAGMPWRGPVAPPAAMSSAARRAELRARSAVTET
ncbi:hypothetical protein ADK49_18670 [Streptomyces sp. WM6349]|nr:hypothetical protein ADK49_18670 [Streptomyces sp. WM6349]KOV37045.1 hypothetical protein ADK98_38095 [Streptomyces sp. H036]